MAAAKNCLKLCLLSMDNPNELEKAVIMANERLCENNDQTFFVTVFLGVLDLKTGLLPPLLRRQQDGNVFQPLRMTRNFAFALMEDWQYVSDEVHLTKGDVIFFYTDGVTKAENKERNMYSMDKLTAFLNSESAGKANSMQEILGCVWANLGKFVGDTEQSDDITMLACFILFVTAQSGGGGNTFRCCTK